MADVTWREIGAAARRIAPFAHKTPVLANASVDRRAGAIVRFKCENFQRTGSFKFRGATNAVAALSPSARARGVYAHSSGNHAQALALAARLHGTAAHIVMPSDARPVKRAATEAYGARVVLCPPTDEGRRSMAARIGDETGATFVHPHDDPLVIAGQGTAAVELLREAGDFDTVLVPVGGGGLLSGTLIAVRTLCPRAHVIGCEPAGADDAYRGLAAGRRIVDFRPDTIADGLRTPLGERTFEIIRRLVDEIVRVTDEEIADATRFIWERMKIVIEPSSAVAVAPLWTGAIPAPGRRIGIILSGGNIELRSDAGPPLSPSRTPSQRLR